MLFVKIVRHAYYHKTIRSCNDTDTQKLVNRQFCKKLAAVEKAARMRLERLAAATSLQDDRKGQYSIRINDRYRVCFVWKDNGAEDVEVVDYH